MNDRINEILNHLATIAADFWMFNNIQLNCDGMAAILVYEKDQSKHNDESGFMTLDDANLGNSSFRMINAEVNALVIKYNPSPSNQNPYHYQAINEPTQSTKEYVRSAFKINDWYCCCCYTT